MRSTLILLIAVAGAAQPSHEQAIDERVQAVLKSSGAPSVSVAVVEGNKTTYAKAFGKSDTEKDIGATPRTRYAAGSISKQFTAAAILLAQEEGKLSLEDRVAKYLPGLTRASEVTVRQLLAHVSGYEDYAPQDYIIPEWTRPTTTTAILDRWAKKPLNFDPGTRWQYSNTGYVAAAAVFEKATGRKLGDFLAERIFKPLGMTTAGDCEAASADDATAYTRYALGPLRPARREGAGWYFGAGQLCMTAGDLAKWNIAFNERRILSAASWDEFTREVKLSNGKSTNYALGLAVREQKGVTIYSHSGEVSGFLAANTAVPARKIGVTILSNSDNTNLIGPLSAQLVAFLLSDSSDAPAAELAQVRSIYEQLRRGQIDRDLFSANANAYFGKVALGDFRESLGPLGTVKDLSRTGEQSRGGMTHRSYRLETERAKLSLNVYVLANGKYEQFLVSEER